MIVNELNGTKDKIFESPAIRSILKLISYDSWLVLDLDNTVMEPLCELGSDQWFAKLIEYACTLIPDEKEAIAAVVAIYHEVQHILHVKVVEPSIIKIINALQDIGIPVIGLTARDAILKETTLRQLDEIGINFREHIIFCDGKKKGECFKEFLQHCKKRPQHIVMADDKENHLRSVKEAAESMGIAFNGVRYGFLDDKVSKLDLKDAHIQLVQIKHKLTTSTQTIIERLQILPHDAPQDDSKYLACFVTEPCKQHVGRKGEKHEIELKTVISMHEKNKKSKELEEFPRARVRNLL